MTTTVSSRSPTHLIVYRISDHLTNMTCNCFLSGSERELAQSDLATIIAESTAQQMDVRTTILTCLECLGSKVLLERRLQKLSTKNGGSVEPKPVSLRERLRATARDTTRRKSWVFERRRKAIAKAELLSRSRQNITE